ncbi:hypothetical protein HPB52_005399 [Rhipicephalus sanguineus]|uniref:Uncharacterized protein n=1 Tax=Rhipicephalus sanguineus TaxID=34632 RepID=A0A9D4PYF4_RHISA|nr:hypothetical protein HPB52_005399 [Rhipicephalus sanguineus]
MFLTATLPIDLGSSTHLIQLLSNIEWIPDFCGEVKFSLIGVFHPVPRRRSARQAERDASRMPLEEMAFGEEISRQEDEASGWIVARSRKKQRQDFTPGYSSAGNSSARPAHPKGPINKLIAASRLPRLPKDHCRVVVRPQGGMGVRKVTRIKVTQALVTAACLSPPQAEENIVCANEMQNIFVISTPHVRHAEAYAKMKRIRVGETLHEVSTYVTPPGDTCRGVVRGIDPELSDDRLGELFVHARTPKVLGVRRIKQTPTVIVLFDGMKVPNYVMCGTNMIRCTLYRRQIDACRTSGKLRHRLDVCPTPTVITCPDCGVSSPLENHTCHPKCSICGGAHPTRRIGPAKAGTRRQRRRKTNKQRAEFVPQQAAGLGLNQGGGLDTPGRGAGHRSRSRDRSASCVRTQQEPTWAERVGPKQQATARIQQQERENATLRIQLQDIKEEVEELRQRERTPEGALKVQQAEEQPKDGKRKATDPPVDIEDFSDFKQETTGVVREIKEAIAGVSSVIESLS